MKKLSKAQIKALHHASCKDGLWSEKTSKATLRVLKLSGFIVETHVDYSTLDRTFHLTSAGRTALAAL